MNSPALVDADDGAVRRPRSPDSEKITVNLGFVDLGQIDLIVADGFYSNRTDFIRTAIRNQLAHHSDELRQSASRKNFDLGLHDYSRQNLEALRQSGRAVHIRVLGLLRIAADVSPISRDRRLPLSPFWVRFKPVPPFNRPSPIELFKYVDARLCALC